MAHRNHIIAMGLIGLFLASCGNGNGDRQAAAPQEYPLLEVKPEDRSLSVKYTAVLPGVTSN